MPFDKDAETDPRLSGLSLAALHARYLEQYAGQELLKLMKKHSQAAEDPKIAARLVKALKAAFADLVVLVEAVPSEGSDELPGEIVNEQLLREIYWRLHDNWKAETPPALKMIDVSGDAPAWTDVVALFGELNALDHDGGDGDSFPVEWYDDLLSRFESRLGKDKPKVKKVGAKKSAAKKAALVPKEPPPDATIVDYSTKGTFEVGQWVRHPKFGIGYVEEAAQHVTMQFGLETKVLAHVAAIAAPLKPKFRPIKPAGDTIELARAAGVEIQRFDARVEEDK